MVFALNVLRRHGTSVTLHTLHHKLNSLNCPGKISWKLKPSVMAYGNYEKEIF